MFDVPILGWGLGVRHERTTHHGASKGSLRRTLKPNPETRTNQKVVWEVTHGWGPTLHRSIHFSWIASVD